MKRAIALFLMITLAGCGADGEPVQPTANAAVTLTPNGVSLGTRLGFGRGPLRVSLGATL